MSESWKRWRAVAGLGTVLVLIIALLSAAAPPASEDDPVEKQSAERVTVEDSKVLSTAGEPTRTGARDGDGGLLVRSTDSGGAVFECLGTVSHASVDNNFARLMNQGRKHCGTDTGLCC